MKRPYCIVDGERIQLHYKDGVLRFPDDNRPMPDLNNMALDYFNGKTDLKESWDYYSNSGCSYEMVWSLFHKNGCNSHRVTQGTGKTKSFKLYQ